MTAAGITTEEKRSRSRWRRSCRAPLRWALRRSSCAGRCRTLCERVLARVSGAAVPWVWMRVDARPIARRDARSRRAALRPVFRRRPVLLASRDPARPSPTRPSLPPPRRYGSRSARGSCCTRRSGAASCRARTLHARRRGAARRKLRLRAAAADRRSLRRHHGDLLRQLLADDPRRARGHGAAELAFISTAITAA